MHDQFICCKVKNTDVDGCTSKCDTKFRVRRFRKTWREEMGSFGSRRKRMVVRLQTSGHNNYSFNTVQQLANKLDQKKYFYNMY